MSSPTAETDRSRPSDLLHRVERALEEKVRPGLRQDGGDVQVVGIDEDKIVQVRWLGACNACSSSIAAHTMLAEKAVKAQVPEVRFLEAVP